MNSPLTRLTLVALILATTCTLRAADALAPTGFSRKVLVEQDLTTAGKHGVTALASFAPGAVTPKHTHPGEEFIYVIEGDVRLEIDGQPSRDLHPGDACVIPAGAAHLARNLGATPAKAVSTYFLETGKPLASPAPGK